MLDLVPFGLELLALPIARLDVAVDVATLGFLPFPLELRGRGSEVNGRLPVDPLGLKAAVIYARLMAVALKITIGQLCPMLPPRLKLSGAVPFPRFFAKTIRPDLAEGQEDVNVVVAVVAISAGGMNNHVRDHPLADEVFTHEVRDKLLALRVGQLVRKTDFDFTGKLGVLASFEAFDFGPKLCAVMCPGGNVIGRKDTFKSDAALAAIIVDFARSFVRELIAGIIGGFGNSALSPSTTYDLRGQVKDCHPSKPPFSPIVGLTEAFGFVRRMADRTALRSNV